MHLGELTQPTYERIADTKEISELISPAISAIENFDPSAGLSLPLYSMTAYVDAKGQILLQPSDSGAEMTGRIYPEQITDDGPRR